jgi:MinD-like ATPase involved in chromosome partitioning or flagellar assembly
VTTFVCFHSLKGGTGKTTLASNLAAFNASKGLNVCLMDFDFRAPSLHVFFKEKPNFWLNDFFNDKCNIHEALCQIKHPGVGKLVVGFANPSTEAMREMMTKDRDWEANALRHILSTKNEMQKEGYDHVIFDTSPGIQYSSFNAMAASNLVVLVMNRDELFRGDIVEFVNKIYKQLGRRIGIALNKVLFCSDESEKKGSEETSKRSADLRKNVEAKFGCPVLALIPCFCEILVGGYKVYALQQPNHPFVAEVAALATHIGEKTAG